jgi:hypothetical protein
MAKLAMLGADVVTVRESNAEDPEARDAGAVRCPNCGLLAAEPVYELVGLRYVLDHMRCTNASCRSYEPNAPMPTIHVAVGQRQRPRR